MIPEGRPVLAIKLKHIGDVLLMAPALHALRRAYPANPLYALVPRGTEEVLEANPDLAGVLTFDREARGWGRVREEWRLLRAVRRLRPAVALEFGKGDREAILGAWSGAPVRVGYEPDGAGFLGRRLLLTHRVPQAWDVHTVESNLDLVRALGVAPAGGRLRLHVREEEREEARRLLGEAGVRGEDLLVVVHPVSRWLFKGWTVEGTATLIRRLAEGRGARVALTSGPAPREMERARAVHRASGEVAIDLAGRLGLRQLAVLLERADLFVGVDSAPMHMAAAVGTPVVALFGPSRDVNWAPWGDGHRVLAVPLPCRPCGQDGCGGTKRSLCLELLDPGAVLAAVEAALAEVWPRPLGRGLLSDQRSASTAHAGKLGGWEAGKLGG